ncbi:MAG: GWxTD domain-containing protein [Candidatus Latescibacterota bacterium]|nr:MAG: GWxTD domain-containing protein [Candidatus Latescibacterota bacterium]
MMHRITSVITLTALLAAASAGVTIAAETVGKGDIELFLDSAAFRSPDGRAIQEIYIRIPNSELRFKEMDGRFESRIELNVKIKDSEGKELVDQSEEMGFHEERKTDAEDALQFHTVIKRFRLDEGEYKLFCEVMDLYAPKVSLLGMVRGSRKTSKVEYYHLDVPGFPEETMSVSGAKFLWRVKGKGSQRVFHPNPSRLYGLYRDSLCVYIESYVPQGLAEAEPINFRMEILDQNGVTVKEASLPLPKLKVEKGGALVTYPIVIQEDLNTLAAGTYTLYVNAGLSDQLLVRMRCGAFSVAWDMRTWEVSRRDYIAEARFLLGGQDDYDDFEKKSIGEQEKILDKMWRELDPDPSTGVNEAYQKYLARLAYVAARYADYQTGIFTDRGLIYLRYGPPDEIEVDVVPQSRESISDALQKVDDKYHPINYSNTGARLRYARPGKNILVDPRRLGMVGEQGDVGYPYELWVYHSGGDPIRERDQALEQDIGMRFIFIDTEGYGRYKLESSSAMLSK